MPGSRGRQDVPVPFSALPPLLSHMRKFAALTVLILAACSRKPEVATAPSPSPSPAPAPAAAKLPAITSADQLLAAMHDRYTGKWYRTLTFTQKSTYFRPDGTVLREETWYEAGSMPGK